MLDKTEKKHPKPIDIREAIKKARLEKIILEKTITEMLRIFEEETGLGIETIRVDRQRTVGDNRRIVSALVGVSVL